MIWKYGYYQVDTDFTTDFTGMNSDRYEVHFSKNEGCFAVRVRTCMGFKHAQILAYNPYSDRVEWLDCNHMHSTFSMLNEKMLDKKSRKCYT